MTGHPFDELAAILNERQFKRKTFLAVLLDSLDPITQKSREWFGYETKAISKEIEVLGAIMPEEIPIWNSELEQIRKKFDSALEYIEEVAKKAKRGEVRSVSDIYKRPPAKKAHELPGLVLPVPPKREKTPLDAAESILALWDAASDLENLVKRVELEATRMLRLRQVIKKEVMRG